MLINPPQSPFFKGGRPFPYDVNEEDVNPPFGKGGLGGIFKTHNLLILFFIP
jgi:hypothetical protein